MPRALWGQDSSITIAGRPVQIAIASVSPSTVRVTMQPLVSGAAQPVVTKRRAGRGRVGPRAGSWRTARTPVRAGDLHGSIQPRRVADDRHRHAAGERMQTLTFDAQRPSMNFVRWARGHCSASVKADRSSIAKGSTFGTRNGQGGYQLRTHGGRVPIQWLMSTDGWGMYIHQPLGAFDLTGTRRQADADRRRACRSTCLSSHREDPKVLMREYARITGFAELPAVVGVRLHAVASHAGGPGRDRMGGADVPREAAAVRRIDLSRHRVHAVRLEHAQRRVWLEGRRTFPTRRNSSTRRTRATTKSCCMS